MLTLQQFIKDWRSTALGERQSYQLHFLNLCEALGQPRPDAQGLDAQGRTYAFEYGLKKDSGGQGFADVFYERHFAIEYKAAGKYKDLKDAYQQLLQYRERLNNPPLLVVTDIENWEIHTNWPNTEKRVYKFTHSEIEHRAAVRKWLQNLFEAPEQLHPNRNSAQVTTDAAEVFHTIAEDMRREGADSAERIAHFLTKLVFCLFAEDVSLLPSGPGGQNGIFAEIIDRTYREPERFSRYAADLFKAMAEGGEIMFQKIPYFNGSLFDDVTVETVSPEALGKLATAAKLNWESVEPAIFGTLFERSLDPGKRAQLGAHYTSREDILLILEPVLMQPLRREWEAIRAEAQPLRVQLDAATTPKERVTTTNALQALREKMLHRLREIKVLDPACGSGNFLYVSLQLLMDMEKAVITDPLFEGLTLAIPEVHPRQMYGIEINPIAHDLASIVVWIGYIQWQQNNGYATLTRRTPILESLKDNIRQMDAVMKVEDYVPPPDSRPAAQVLDKAIEEHEPSHRTPPELWEKLKPIARQMRHEPTPAEDALWQAIRNHRLENAHFRRQHSIDRFIVDFYCHEARLVIEVDGSIHQYTVEEDALRQAFLESRGLRVLRFSNDKVLNDLPTVLDGIRDVLKSGLMDPTAIHPTLNPSPLRGEGLEEGLTPPLHEMGRGLGGGVLAVSEPDWPVVDVIVGNPPFLGGNKMRGELGDAYVDHLRKLYEGRVPGGADLVCYWFEKARAHIAQGKAKRAGLLATQAIRAGANREVLKRIKEGGDIFMAWSDREWVLNGAAVRVSMVGFDNAIEQISYLNGEIVDEINVDLTSGHAISKAKRLLENKDICLRGDEKHGDFDITSEVAQEMLKAINPSGRLNSDVIKPYIGAMDVVWQPRNMWIIDFLEMPLEEAELYVAPMIHVRTLVKPERDKNNRKMRREKWWQHGEIIPNMRRAIKTMSRFIVTARVAKHRLFDFVNSGVVPDSRLYIFAREDDYFFGVLHSKIHEIWSLATSSRHGVGNDPTYNAQSCFETFPFPWSPGQEAVNSPAYAAVAAAARALHVEREAWLNGNDPSLMHPTLNPSPLHGEGLEAGLTPSLRGEGLEANATPYEMGRGLGGGVNAAGVKRIKERTLTNLYNALNVWRGKESMKTKSDAADFAPRLADLHDALDAAVCAAYGWPADVLRDEDEILRRLLALNLERSQ